jgi:phosphatidylserine decarboxylase
MKMKKIKLFNHFFFGVCVLAICVSCNSYSFKRKDTYGAKTIELIEIVEKHPDIKKMLVKSIEQAKKINPDKITNPAQDLESYFDFIAYAEKAMPWELLPEATYSTLYSKLDQSLCYFYFINDQPLSELEGKGYYNNSLQYVEPYSTWLISFDKSWGQHLATESSWNSNYYKLLLDDKKFGLQNDWYEDPKHWKSFNQFFARYLKSPDKRPIAQINNDSVLVSPADAVPQGIWQVDEKSNIVEKEGVAIKSATLRSVEKLIGEESGFEKEFAEGVLTHTYLDVNDYHRYHFPLSGTIKEIRVIPGENAAGCIITWDAAHKRYIYDASVPGWQSIEARGCVILETEKFGLVALMPIGMSQVCSVNFENNLKVGQKVQKGDMLGYFLFGGSDFVMIFQKKAGLVLNAKKDKENHAYQKLLMGENYGKLGNR